MSLAPYWSDGLSAIYHGDSRELLPHLGQFDLVLTDPPWPNSSVAIPGGDRPFELLREVATFWPALCRSAVVHLGCDTDPRFLLAIPPELPFVRVVWCNT